MLSVVAGVAGAARNAATALCVGGRVVAVCEQERITRTRQAGLQAGRLPAEALDAVLRMGNRAHDDVETYAVAEDAIRLPATLRVERFDHHFAHAATSFHTSPFQDATIVVCDRSGDPEVTVWKAKNGEITRTDFGWTGAGIATVYSAAVEAFGFSPNSDEHRFEALAQVSGSTDLHAPHVEYRGNGLDVPPGLCSSIAALSDARARTDGTRHRAGLAAAIQDDLGDALVELLRQVAQEYGGQHLCVGGGLFFNSYFNARIATADIFDRVFVPINPGNAGVSIGAAVAVAGQPAQTRLDEPLSPFLGPEFGIDEIKATLDNCKLCYDHCHDGQVIDRTVAALAKGRLVGWFRGRMEWGPRALGNRSILASPVAPYVLDNLNVFLKRRDSQRPYSVSVCEEDLPRFFKGPAQSRFMEYEYEVIDRDAIRPVLPLDASRLRVQTVPASAGIFHTLIKAFGEVTGVPILVNTSYNGFNEPIVCSPRDAVRVFYGTGLDMAFIGNFLLRK